MTIPRLLLALSSVCAWAAPVYQVQKIPLPAGDYYGLDGWAINEAGVIAGNAKSSTLPGSVFTGTPSGVQLLLGTPSGIRFDINNSMVVANSNFTTSLLGGLQPLPAGSTVTSVNDSGLAAGGNGGHATIWDSTGSPTTVSTPVGMTNSFIQDINNSGQLAGVGFVSGNPVPFLGTAAGVTVIPLPGLGGTGIARINQMGDVVGASTGGTWLLPQGGALILLPTAASTPTGINNHRQVVGRLGFGGWIWDEASGFRNLNDLLPTGWRLVSAEGINDAGQIVAQALDASNTFWTVRLDPVPEPSTALLMAAGGALIWRIRRRRVR